MNIKTDGFLNLTSNYYDELKRLKERALSFSGVHQAALGRSAVQDAVAAITKPSALALGLSMDDEVRRYQEQALRLSGVHQAALGSSAVQDAVATMTKSSASALSLSMSDEIRRYQEQALKLSGVHQAALRNSTVQEAVAAITQPSASTLGLSMNDEIRRFQEQALSLSRERQAVLGSSALQNEIEALTRSSVSRAALAFSANDEIRRIMKQASSLSGIEQSVLEGSAFQKIKEMFEASARPSLTLKNLLDGSLTRQRWSTKSQIKDIQNILSNMDQYLQEVELPYLDKSEQHRVAKNLEENFSVLKNDKHNKAERPLLTVRQDQWLTILSVILGILSLLQNFQEGPSVGIINKLNAGKTLVSPAKELFILSMQLVAQGLISIEVNFEVRERRANVRSEPRHGSTVEGFLLPYSEVKGLDQKGKWVLVKYYDVLSQEHRQGWVLKKYLERVFI